MPPTASCTFSLDLRHHNNLKYSACNNSTAHLAFWFALLLRRRSNLDSGAQHRLAGAFCDFLLSSSLSRTEASVFTFLFLSHSRAKSWGCSARRAALPRKRLLQPRGPACPCAKKPCERCKVAT